MCVEVVGGQGFQCQSSLPLEISTEKALSIETPPNIFQSYLDTLLDSSFSHGSSTYQKKVAFLKTHKTGSATMTGVLFRFACRHNARVLIEGHLTQTRFELVRQWRSEFDPLQLKVKEPQQFDMVFQHIVPALTKYRDIRVPFSVTLQYYKFNIHEPFIFTIVREPVAAALSWLSYFEKKQKGETESHAIMRIPENRQCSEFGIYTQEDLDSFLTNSFPSINLICLTEKFDECLVLLRRRLNWSPIDISYLQVHNRTEEWFGRCSFCLPLN
jgi:hypothetical protein